MITVITGVIKIKLVMEIAHDQNILHLFSVLDEINKTKLPCPLMIYNRIQTDPTAPYSSPHFACILGCATSLTLFYPLRLSTFFSQVLWIRLHLCTSLLDHVTNDNITCQAIINLNVISRDKS